MMLQHLGSGDLTGILVEHSTDAILLAQGRNPELVSIKHREVDQFEDSGWSWTTLNNQDVFTGLHRQWRSAGKECTLAFWTNAGFVRKMRELRNVLAYNATPSPYLIKAFSNLLKVPHDEAREFLRALSTPPEPLPRRKRLQLRAYISWVS